MFIMLKLKEIKLITREAYNCRHILLLLCYLITGILFLPNAIIYRIKLMLLLECFGFVVMLGLMCTLALFYLFYGNTKHK